MKRKILGSIYKTVGHWALPQQMIAYVAAETDQHLPKPTWQAYVCIVEGQDEKEDEQWTCHHGAKLSRLEAAGFFPKLDIKKYKTQ